MAESNDNLFTNLRGLVWSAIIGVASFQILAPNVWGYIHEATDISYKAAYWVFTDVYFLSIPVGILIWLCSNRELLKKYFSPYDNESEVGKEHGQILWSLFAFVCLQFVLSSIALWSLIVTNFSYIVLIGYAVFCGAFLIVYARAARDRINYKDPACPSEEYRDAIFKYYRQLMFAGAAAYIVLFAIGLRYVCRFEHGKEDSRFEGKSKSAFDAGSRGFALVCLKDTLDNRYARLKKFEDSLQYGHHNDTLDAVSTDCLFLPDKSHHDTLTICSDPVLIGYYHSLLAASVKMDTLYKHLQDTSLDVEAGLIDSISRHVPRLQPDPSDRMLRYKDDLKYIGLLKNFLRGLSKEADTQSKSQLGIQLRGVQMKGLVLLISLFFTVFSLYIFLSINQKLQGAKLKRFQNHQRLKEDIDENLVIKQEDNVGESTAIANSLWLYLTVIVWLLVPLLKPVKDADINVKQTYKTHNFSNPDNSTLVSTSNSNSHSNDTATFVQKNVRIDSIYIKGDSLKYGDLMKRIDQMNRQVKEMHEQIFSK